MLLVCTSGPRTHLCDAVALQQHLLVLHVVARQLEHGGGAAELDLQGLRDIRRDSRRDRSRDLSLIRATISATSRQLIAGVLSGACATASGDTRNDSRPETCVLLWPAARFISMVTGLIAPFLSSGDSPSTTTCDARRPQATRWHTRKRGDIYSRHLGHISGISRPHLGHISGTSRAHLPPARTATSAQSSAGAAPTAAGGSGTSRPGARQAAIRRRTDSVGSGGRCGEASPSSARPRASPATG